MKKRTCLIFKKIPFRVYDSFQLFHLLDVHTHVHVLYI